MKEDTDHWDEEGPCWTRDDGDEEDRDGAGHKDGITE
jgi:hypothetical protein